MPIPGYIRYIQNIESPMAGVVCEPSLIIITTPYHAITAKKIIPRICTKRAISLLRTRGSLLTKKVIAIWLPLLKAIEAPTSEEKTSIKRVSSSDQIRASKKNLHIICSVVRSIIPTMRMKSKTSLYLLILSLKPRRGDPEGPLPADLVPVIVITFIQLLFLLWPQEDLRRTVNRIRHKPAVQPL